MWILPRFGLADEGAQQASRGGVVSSHRHVGVVNDFLHDLPPRLTTEATARLREQSSTPFADPWPLTAWPKVPAWVLIAGQDRLFPGDFQRRVAHRHLGVVPDEMDGGHFLALGQPQIFSDRLEAYRAVPAWGG